MAGIHGRYTSSSMGLTHFQNKFLKGNGDFLPVTYFIETNVNNWYGYKTLWHTTVQFLALMICNHQLPNRTLTTL